MIDVEAHAARSLSDGDNIIIISYLYPRQLGCTLRCAFAEGMGPFSGCLARESLHTSVRKYEQYGTNMHIKTPLKFPGYSGICGRLARSTDLDFVVKERVEEF